MSTSYREEIESHDHLAEREAKELFIGKKADKYFRRWKFEDNGELKKPSLNWAAFFFTFLWAFYRRMYKPGLILIGLFLGLDLLFFTTGIEVPTYYMGLGVSIFFGAFGNNLYYSHVTKKTKAILNWEATTDEKKERLKKEGGGSVPALFLGIGVFILYLVLTGALAFLTSATTLTGEGALQFGEGWENNQVAQVTDEFAPVDTVTYSLRFPSGEGGEFSVVIENEESGSVYQQWQEQVPSDWTGVGGEFMAPSEEGTYVMKVLRDDEVVLKNEFEVVQGS